MECILYGVALLPITLSVNWGIRSTPRHSFLISSSVGMTAPFAVRPHGGENEKTAKARDVQSIPPIFYCP